MKFLKIFFTLVLAVPIVFVAALFIVPEKIDFSTYKGEIESYIKSKTGFEVSLGDALEIQLLPQPRIASNNIKVRSFTGGRPLFSAHRLELTISLKDLFSMNVSIKKLLIENPVVYLYRDIDNKANWQPKRVKRRGGKSVDLSFIKGLGDIVISNAQFVFENDFTGRQFKLKEGQLSVNGSQLSHTNLKVSGLLNDERIESSIYLNLSNMQDVNAKGDVFISDNKFNFAGVIGSIFSEASFKGDIKLEGPTVFNSFYKILAVPPGQRYVQTPLILEGIIDFSKKGYKLKNLKTTFSTSPTNITLVSDIFYKYLDKSKKKSHLEIKISAADFINLEPFVFCQPSNKEKNKFSWSEKIIDLTFIKQLNADMTLEAPKGFSCAGKKIDYARLRLTAENSRIDMRQLTIGKGVGRLSGNGYLSTKGIKPKGGLQLKSTSFDITKFMNQAVQKRVSLPLALDLNVSFTGKSSAEWVASLKGALQVSISNITTVGVNIENLQSVLTSAFGMSHGINSMGEGAFSMNADIQEGVLRTNNAWLTFPNIEVETTGKVDLRRMVMNFKANPNSKNILGFDIPVLIKGSIFSPLIMPEITGIQGQATVIGTLVGGPVGAALGSVIGSMLEIDATRDISNTEKKQDVILNKKQRLKDEVLMFLKSD